MFSPGKVARILTPEGSMIRSIYAKTNISSGEHTGAKVPLYFNREGELALSPFMRQRDTYYVMMRYLEL